MPPAGTRARDRYAPYAAVLIRAPGDNSSPNTGSPAGRAEILSKLHAPILFLNGGPSDSGYASAKSNLRPFSKCLSCSHGRTWATILLHICNPTEVRSHKPCAGDNASAPRHLERNNDPRLASIKTA